MAGHLEPVIFSRRTIMKTILPISIKDTVRFLPDGENGAIYLIEVPPFRKKAAWRRAVLATGAIIVTQDMLFNSLREGIKKLIEGKECDSLLAVIDEFEEQIKKDKEDETDEEKEAKEELAKVYTDIENKIRRSYLPFAELLADRTYSFDIQQIEAIKFFLCGIENSKLKFKQIGEQVPDDLIDQMSELHALGLAIEILSLMGISKEQEKNSESPSQLQVVQSPLTTENSLQTAATGTSTETCTE